MRLKQRLRSMEILPQRTARYNVRLGGAKLQVKASYTQPPGGRIALIPRFMKSEIAVSILREVHGIGSQHDRLAAQILDIDSLRFCFATAHREFNRGRPDLDSTLSPSNAGKHANCNGQQQNCRCIPSHNHLLPGKLIKGGQLPPLPSRGAQLPLTDRLSAYTCDKVQCNTPWAGLRGPRVYRPH